MGRRSEAGPLRLMTNGGCREARPLMGTRSEPVTNMSSRFFWASVKPCTASQNQLITCEDPQNFKYPLLQHAWPQLKSPEGRQASPTDHHENVCLEPLYHLGKLLTAEAALGAQLELSSFVRQYKASYTPPDNVSRPAEAARMQQTHL